MDDNKIIQSPSKRSEMSLSSLLYLSGWDDQGVRWGKASIATIFEQFSWYDKLVQPTIEKKRGTQRDSMRVKEKERCWWVRGGWFWRNRCLLPSSLFPWLFLDVKFRPVFFQGKTTWHSTLCILCNDRPVWKQKTAISQELDAFTHSGLCDGGSLSPKAIMKIKTSTSPPKRNQRWKSHLNITVVNKCVLQPGHKHRAVLEMKCK